MPPEMTPDSIAQAADLLCRARLERQTIQPLPAACRPANSAEAYAVQRALHPRLAAALGPIAGWKLGCTNAAMQAYLGVPEATYGGMPAAGVHHGDTTVAHSAFVAPGVECEIALRLGEAVPAGGGSQQAPHSQESIAQFVDAALVAAEIVDNRYADFRTLGAPTLIADDFFHAGAVLGTPCTRWRELDLAALAGRTFVDGAAAGSGHGADVLGHPLAALAWLANQRAALGEGLPAGQIVLTGAVVLTQWVRPGSTARVEVDTLGALEVVFAG